jgi:hypothetical protein
MRAKLITILAAGIGLAGLALVAGTLARAEDPPVDTISGGRPPVPKSPTTTPTGSTAGSANAIPGHGHPAKVNGQTLSSSPNKVSSGTKPSSSQKH